MKIALLTEKYTPDIGGLAISTERLGNLLAIAGHEVQIFAPSLNLPPSEMRTHRSSGISVTRFGVHKRSDDTLVNWFELIINSHKSETFDVLQAYFLPQAGFIASYAGKYLGIPSVVSIRGNDIEQAAFDPSKFSHVMYVLQNADALTTNASELMNKAKAFFDRDVTLIPNGIDADLFTASKRNDLLAEVLGLENEGKKREERKSVIGFAGELREKKGLKTLLSAYTQINKESPAILLIVGEVRAGGDKLTFDEFKNSIPNSHIIVTGAISHKDMPAYYSLMDVFVHPSLRDGMPNALLEAMACERAVIATAVGGTMDALENGKNGLLVNVNDANELANAIDKLLDEPEKRIELGAAARTTIKSKFTPGKELEANLNVYRKLGISL